MHKVVLRNASITFLSRVLGFLRDILVARYIGVSVDWDAFLVVFKLPNFFRRLIAEGVFSQAVLPAVSKAKDSRLFLEHVYAWLWILIIMISFPFMRYPEGILRYFVHGYGQEHAVFQTAVGILPWVFPYLGCMACCGFYTVQLNLHREYEVGSRLPIILNLLLIFGVYQYYGSQDIAYMAKAVLLSGILQVMYCIYRVYRIGGVILPRFRSGCDLSGLMYQASYGFLAQVVTYLSSAMDLLLISFLLTGSLSWLYYAERLAFLPIGVISVILANVVLTDLTEACKLGDQDRMRGILQNASRWVMMTGLPAMVGGVFLAEHIIALLFGSTHFQWKDVLACAAGFRILALAIPFLMMVRVWNAVPYAFSNPEDLLSMTLRSFIISLLVSMATLSILQHVAICLGVFVSGLSNAYQLYRYIQIRVGDSIVDERLAQKVLPASVFMGLVLIVGNGVWPLTSVMSKVDILGLLLLKSILSLGMFVSAMRFQDVRLDFLKD